ncbi:MAG: hypothetical protein K9G40_11625 [Crocinitomicaceae bacterium]|nr:hypothetical protein [Crocinitomicaceae bacterium]
MKQLILLISLFLAFGSTAQSLEQYNKERIQTDKRLMIGLGSWATTNFVVSGVGWATVPTGEAHYFHQMNVMWNTVNIGLAIPGYLKAKKANTSLSFSETIRTQHQTEKIFLINTGLDIGYMTGGLLLRSEAKTNSDKQDQFNGYGSSLLLQGGFLFVFDIVAYAIHNRHSKKSLEPMMNKIELSSTGLGLKWNLQTNAPSTKKRFL